MRTLPLDMFIENRRKAISVFEDFYHYTTAEDFSTVASDSGTAVHSDAVGGVLAINPSDGTVADNDETYVKGTTEKFKYLSDQPIWFEARVKFTEANTNTANVIVGLMNAVAADSLQDNGGGPPASSNHVVFFKTDGSLKWQVESSISTTQTTNTVGDVTSAGDGTYRRLGIEVRPVTSTLAEVLFFIDGNQCKDATTGLPIKHTVDFTSNGTEMQEIMGIKNGAITAVETLYVDYIAARQLRA
jgi:hypothetical protein